jgi:enoyl-CoA hydratase/carnithine racemase
MELKDAAVVRMPGAFTRASVADLRRALAAGCGSDAPVVVLTGAGDDVFCTGLALHDDGPLETEPFREMLALLSDAPKPTIAFVDGAAIGGGFGMACACDWLVATERATFGLPELLWGLIPAMIWPAVVARVGANVARQWAVSAHTRSAAEAHDAGAVDELVAVDSAARRVQRAVRMLSRLEPVATQRLRQWHRETQTTPHADALMRGARLTQEMAASRVARARVSAFARGESPWS